MEEVDADGLSKRDYLILKGMSVNLPTVMDEMTSIPNHCVASTGVAVEVLKSFDIPARPTPVDLFIFNEAAWPLYEQGVPMEEWPDEAHSMGIFSGAVEETDKTWNGHLIVRMPKHDLLMDLNVDALTRPNHGITLEPHPIKADLGVFLEGRPASYKTADNAVVIYAYAPENIRWKSSPDWLGRRSRYLMAIDWLRHGIRNELERHGLE